MVIRLASALILAVASWSVAAHDHATTPQVKSEFSAAWLERQEKAPRLAVGADFDGNGRFWLARVIGKNLFVSYSDDEGKSFSPQVRVTPIPELISADGESRPQITAWGQRVYVSWTQALPQAYAGHIRFSMSDDGGRRFREPQTVNDDTRPITHRFNAMVADQQGITIAWIDKRDGAGRSNYRGAAIYAARSTDGGQSFQANERVADHSCECCRLGIASDLDGTPVVFWRHIFGRNVRDFALARLGETLQRVSEDGWQIDACPHHGGALAIDSQGDRHIVWFTGAEQSLGLHYRRIENGVPSPTIAFGNTERQASHPMIGILGKSVHIVWREYDGKAHRIMEMNSPDRGTTWSSPTELASTNGAADDPLIRSGRGALWLVWNTADGGLRLMKLTP